MLHSYFIKKTLSRVAFIFGILFIVNALIGLYPYFVITISKQWPAYLNYLQLIHSDIFAKSILSIIYVLIDILGTIHQIVTGIILIASCKTSRYQKAIIVCGFILILFWIETIITIVIMDTSLPFSSLLGRSLLTLFVVGYGLYLQNSSRKRR